MNSAIDAGATRGSSEGTTRAEAWKALRRQRARKLNPPRLMRGPLSGAVYVVTVGKMMEHDGELLLEATTKYDVTDQFEALNA